MTFLRAFARLKPGVTPDRRTRRSSRIYVEMLKNVPAAFRKEVTLRVRPLRDRQVGDATTSGLVSAGSGGRSALIACTNVANLLAREDGGARSRTGGSASLGASSGRLMRLVLTESLLLSVAGAAAGLFVAYALSEDLRSRWRRQGFRSCRRRRSIFGCWLAAPGWRPIAAALIGIWPALSVTRVGSDDHVALSDHRGSSAVDPVCTCGHADRADIRAAGQFHAPGAKPVESSTASLGFDTSSVVTASITLSPGKYRTPERQLLSSSSCWNEPRGCPDTSSGTERFTAASWCGSDDDLLQN